MALTLNIPDTNPVSGFEGNIVKPITEGTKVQATESQPSSSGIFGFLDELGNTGRRALNTIADAYAENTANNIVDSTGNPTDQAGGVTPNNQNTDVGFIDKYKTELVIGGAFVLGLTVLLFMTKD